MMYAHKIFIFCCKIAIIIHIGLGVYPSFADYTAPHIKTLKNPYIETTPPDLTPESSEDIEVWKQKLPVQDRELGEYVVIPSTGLIIPIVTLSDTSSDFWKIQQGENIDVNPYLQEGVLDFPIYQTNYGEVGNKILLGHSSYFKKDIGRYKTHFQAIIGLSEGTDIWVYQQHPLNDTFIKYEYQVFASFETTPKDSSVLDSSSESRLTLVTCTPIGGITGRWIVQARFTNKKVEKTIAESVGEVGVYLKTDISFPTVIAKPENTLTRGVYHTKKYIYQNPLVSFSKVLTSALTYPMILNEI